MKLGEAYAAGQPWRQGAAGPTHHQASPPVKEVKT